MTLRRRGAAALMAAVCASLLAQPSAAQPVDPTGRAPQALDAAATVRFALDHAPAMLAQRATVASLLATFTRDRAGEFPTLNAQLQNQIARSSNLSGQFAQFGIAPVSNFSQNTAQILSQYSLYNGTQQLVSQQAKRYVEGAAADLQRQAETVAYDAATGYYNLVARREAVVNAQADLGYQQQLLDVARLSEKVGRVAGVDVLRAEVSVARSAANLVQARTDEANAREVLGVQIGASPDATFALPTTLPEPPLPKNPVSALSAIAKANRPEIASAQASLQAAKLGDAMADSDLRPTVQLQGSFGSQVAPTNFVLRQQQINQLNAAGGNFPPVVRSVPGFWQFGIVSTFTLPLVDYGTRAANHRSARAQIASAQASYDSAVGTVESDVRAAARNASAAAEKLALAKRSAELAAESARIAQLQYKNGLISFSDVTQTQATAVSAGNDLIAARVAYLLSLVKLRLALGPVDPVSAVRLPGGP